MHVLLERSDWSIFKQCLACSDWRNEGQFRRIPDMTFMRLAFAPQPTPTPPKALFIAAETRPPAVQESLPLATNLLPVHDKQMGLIISRLVNILSGLKEKRLLLLGLDAAGKTSLLYKLHLNEVVQTIPTIGFNVERVEYNRMMMTIWDIGGQTKLRPLWRHYFVNTDALIFVVDSSDLERIEEARDEMFHVLRDPNMDSCQTVLILLNKQDVAGAIGPAMMINKLGLDSAGNNPLKRRNWYMQGCCALTGEGVFDGLDWLCQALKKN